MAGFVTLKQQFPLFGNNRHDLETTITSLWKQFYLFFKTIDALYLMPNLCSHRNEAVSKL